jgi:hypothetical protein
VQPSETFFRIRASGFGKFDGIVLQINPDLAQSKPAPSVLGPFPRSGSSDVIRRVFLQQEANSVPGTCVAEQFNERNHP